jgi:hypothetical protein
MPEGKDLSAVLSHSLVIPWSLSVSERKNMDAAL